MRLSRVYLLALAAVVACNGDGNPAKPAGPVTMKFLTPVYSGDTLHGEVTIDAGTATAQTIAIPADSFVDVARGQHTFQYRFDADYLVGAFTRSVDPSSATDVVALPQVANCYSYAVDGIYCLNSTNAPGTIVGWHDHDHLICSAGDFAELCSRAPDPRALGATWPADSAENEYVSQTKLLVAAKVGPELAAASGHVMAMGLARPGDYYPRSLFHTASASDSTRSGNEVWTDARHFPLFQSSSPEPFPVLDQADRPEDRFGLSVKATYFVPSDHQDAIFVRYDIQNISNQDEYRFRHPSEPATGHTITDVYLTPVIDPDIGRNPGVGGSTSEISDDNVTVLPQDSLLVAYDGNFSAAPFVIGSVDFYAKNPGLVGYQLIAGPPGTTARALLFDTNTKLDYSTDALEDATYNYLAGGRAGLPAGCQAQGEVALVCSPETPGDVLMGWSIGPIAALAPGDATSLTLAILVAAPAAGTFQPGTVVAPGNDQLATTPSPVTPIAANLLALATQTKTVAVEPLP
jgi:hypothetical protein